MRQSDIALAYASKGIPVFPCNTSTKSPVPKEGFKAATTDEKTIKSWWRKNPNYLIATPNTSFTVVDVDNHNTCDAGRFLTDNALQRLFSASPDFEKAAVVRTMSGGIHLYFAPTDGVTRKINILPNIDLLGTGGYVILPDQKKYVCGFKLWENTDSLPAFPSDVFHSVVAEMETSTKLARQLKRDFKNGVKREEPLTTPDMHSVPKMTELAQSDRKVTNRSLSDFSEKKARKNSIDYKTGEIVFEQTPDMYKKNKTYKTDYSLVDEFVETGKIVLKPGDITSEKINALFHWPGIQVALAKMLGLESPESAEPRVMRSILPGHTDLRPSMGIRWSGDNTHIIVRDFANHFSDKYQQLDYNLVRLYATIKYGALVPRMKPPEFVVWFLRMMVEAGIIDVSSFKKRYALPIGGGAVYVRVAKGFQLLDAIKQLYRGYDGQSVFSDRFCAAWCGVEPSAGNRAKKMLVEGGYLHIEGEYDCSGGKRDDGFYNTKIFSIVDTKKIRELNNKKKLQKEIEQMAKIVTINGVGVSEGGYKTIKNFFEDQGVSNVPERKNMFVEVGLLEGAVKTEPPATDNSFVMTNLRLAITPSMATGKDSVLMLTGDCEELEELFWSQMEAYDQLPEDIRIISDEPLIGVVVCSDISEYDIDLEEMSVKLSDYLDDQLVLDTFFVRHTTHDGLFKYIMDGKEPMK